MSQQSTSSSNKRPRGAVKRMRHPTLTPQNSDVANLVETKGWVVRKGDAGSKPTTHLFMDGTLGGKLCIPLDDTARSALVEAMCKDLGNNIPFFLIECRTEPVFKMNIDMDYKGDRPLSRNEIVRHARILQHSAKLFYQKVVSAALTTHIDLDLDDDGKLLHPVEHTPGAHEQQALEQIANLKNHNIMRKFLVYVYITPPQQIEVRAGGGGDAGDEGDAGKPKAVKKVWKSAAHFVMPHLIVDEEKALYIRQTFVAELESRCGPRGGDVCNTWEDVVDEQVLANNASLRMAGSSKCEKCTLCSGLGGIEEDSPEGGGKHTVTCPQCKGLCKVNLGRIYALSHIVGEDGTPHEDAADVPLASALRNAMIRTSSKRPSVGFVVYKGAPAYVPVEKRRGRETHDQARARTHKKRDRNLEKESSQRVVVYRSDSAVVRNLLPTIRKFHSMYSEINIKQIAVYKNKRRSRAASGGIGETAREYAIVHVSGKGSQYCLNLADCHRSQQIYFVIHPRGALAQKCFCRCSTVRNTGYTCKDFKSGESYVTGDVVSSIFDSGATSSVDKMARTYSQSSLGSRSSAGATAAGSSAQPQTTNGKDAISSGSIGKTTYPPCFTILEKPDREVKRPRKHTPPSYKDLADVDPPCP